MGYVQKRGQVKKSYLSPFLWCFALLVFASLFHATSIQASELVVSNEFSEVLFQTKINDSVPKNAMEMLKDHVSVETAFGGGYVTAISVVDQKFAEQVGRHWFYYVNGILANVGAALYHPQAEDHIWWTIQPWDGERFIGAVIGAWPEPFVSGYDGKVLPTKIWVAPGFEKAAAAFKQSLQSQRVKEVAVSTFVKASAIDFQNSLSIYVGPWAVLQENQALNDLFQHGSRVGLFLKFEEGKFITLDWQGKKKTTYGKAGCIVALKSAFDQANPIWFVSGTDDESTRNALYVLTQKPELIQNKAGVLLSNEDVIHVPIFSQND